MPSCYTNCTTLLALGKFSDQLFFERVRRSWKWKVRIKYPFQWFQLRLTTQFLQAPTLRTQETILPTATTIGIPRRCIPWVKINYVILSRNLRASIQGLVLLILHLDQDPQNKIEAVNEQAAIVALDATDRDQRAQATGAEWILQMLYLSTTVAPLCP